MCVCTLWECAVCLRRCLPLSLSSGFAGGSCGAGGQAGDGGRHLQSSTLPGLVISLMLGRDHVLGRWACRWGRHDGTSLHVASAVLSRVCVYNCTFHNWHLISFITSIPASLGCRRAAHRARRSRLLSLCWSHLVIALSSRCRITWMTREHLRHQSIADQCRLRRCHQSLIC